MGAKAKARLDSQGSRVGNEDSALKGISLAAMSAAGPSGARHGHLRSFLRTKSNCVVNRLLRVLETFLGRALGGDLLGWPHWILHSQLTILCKLGTTSYPCLGSFASSDCQASAREFWGKDQEGEARIFAIWRVCSWLGRSSHPCETRCGRGGCVGWLGCGACGGRRYHQLLRDVSSGLRRWTL